MDESLIINWGETEDIKPATYICGWCSTTVFSDKGIYGMLKDNFSNDLTDQGVFIYVCPKCTKPSVLHMGDDYPNEDIIYEQVPAGVEYKKILGLEDSVKQRYDDAQRCISMGIWSAAAILCRALLMDVSVSKDAEPGKSFKFYVKYLVKSGYVAENLESVVTEVREIGNKANHKIEQISRAEAKAAFEIMEHALRGIYELPYQQKIRQNEEEIPF